MTTLSATAPLPAGAVALLDQLRQGRPAIFRARGHSMRPSIPDGSLVELSPLRRAQTIPLGSVVLAARPHSLVLHRVVWRRGGVVWAKGDRNLRLDALDTASIAGIATAISVDGRTWKRWDTPRSAILRPVRAACALLASAAKRLRHPLHL